MSLRIQIKGRFKKELNAACRLSKSLGLLQVEEVKGLSEVDGKLQVVGKSNLVLVSGRNINPAPEWRHAGQSLVLITGQLGHVNNFSNRCMSFDSKSADRYRRTPSVFPSNCCIPIEGCRPD